MSIQADYVWNAGRREQYNLNTNVTFDPVTGVNRPFSVFSNRRWPDLGIVLQDFRTAPFRCRRIWEMCGIQRRAISATGRCSTPSWICRTASS
jgi:hypothetical protein